MRAAGLQAVLAAAVLVVLHRPQVVERRVKVMLAALAQAKVWAAIITVAAAAVVQVQRARTVHQAHHQAEAAMARHRLFPVPQLPTLVAVVAVKVRQARLLAAARVALAVAETELGTQQVAQEQQTQAAVVVVVVTIHLAQ